MRKRDLEYELRLSLGQEVTPRRLEETIQACCGIVQSRAKPAEERTGFFQYLADIFRLEGLSVAGVHAAVLLFICLTVSKLSDWPGILPVVMPFLVLAAMPAVFRGRYHRVSEMEAATRASGAQIILAKLILAGAADLVCITVLLCLEIYLHNSCREISGMILYCLVPYLACMAAMLGIVRSCKKDAISICIAVMLAFSAFLGAAVQFLPWLYETSATGFWVAAFLLFAVFYGKEIGYIIKMRKEGKMYGIIA